MQLKELLRIKLKTLTWRCFVEEKDHLWVKEDVVVMDGCVVVVSVVVLRQKSVFSGRRCRCRSCQPSWNVGIVNKQQIFATFHGKLPRSYKSQLKGFNTEVVSLHFPFDREVAECSFKVEILIEFLRKDWLSIFLQFVTVFLVHITKITNVKRGRGGGGGVNEGLRVVKVKFIRSQTKVLEGGFRSGPSILLNLTLFFLFHMYNRWRVIGDYSFGHIGEQKGVRVLFPHGQQGPPIPECLQLQLLRRENKRGLKQTQKHVLEEFDELGEPERPKRM